MKQIWNETQWFAVQARTGAEEFARHQVAALGVDVFLPKARKLRPDRRGGRLPIRALFPSYLFARFCPHSQLRAVRYARGVTRVLSAGETPIPVEEEIILEIRARTDAAGCVTLEDKPWRVGELLQVQDGPLRGLCGRFERELDDRRRVVILLEAIHQARVVVERRRLEIVEAA